MRKRAVLIAFGIAAVSAIVAASLAWFVLSSWVPTRGKALLIQELERRAPLAISIGRMRYEVLGAVELRDVQLRTRDAADVWLDAPVMRVRVNWLALAMRRRVAFHAQAPLERPCRTELMATGNYAPNTQALTLDVRSTDCAVKTIAPPLAGLLPPQLTDGSLRITARLLVQPNHPVTVTGQLAGDDLRWVRPGLRARGDVTINGSAIAALAGSSPAVIDARITVHRGLIEGLPTVDHLSQIEAVAHLADDRLQIERASATALGSMWTLEGMLEPLARPRLTALLTSRVDAARVPEALNPLQRDWQPSGPMALRAVCRGPLAPTPLLDCLAHASFADLTLTGTKLERPITKIAGEVAYDALTREWSIAQLSGDVLGQTCSTRGMLRMAPIPALSLDVDGTLPLPLLNPWLPPDGPLAQISGRAAVSLHVQGPPAFPVPTGRVTLQDVALNIAGPHTIDRANGLLLLQPAAADLRQCAFRLDQQPVTLEAHVAFGATPRITATAGLPQSSQLRLTASLTRQDVTIEEAILSLPHSELKARGTYARSPERASALQLSGVIELSELSYLPFLPLPQLHNWHLMGPATIEAQARGRIAAWSTAEMRARIRAEHLSVRDIPVDQVTCDVEQRDHALRVSIPSVVISGGKGWGELIVAHQPRTHSYELQADLMSLELAKLAQVIPAWHDRTVTGIASAHAKVTGTWETRPTWSGEGWLNASGQELGDLPLLDKLFHGLFGGLAERVGLESLRRAQITQASVQWTLDRERLRTENLRLGGAAMGEPVAVYATGSVGLDQTLDFVVEPELSEGALLQAQTTASLARTFLQAAGRLERLRRMIGRHRLTGTLQKPQYRFELSPQEVFKQLAPASGELLQQLFDAVR